MRMVWPKGSVLCGSLVLLLLRVAVPCVPAAPPTSELADAGLLRAPEPSPKRGGLLRWGGLANSTLYDLHQTGTIANMGPQAPMYDLLVQVDPVHWDQVIPDLAKSWQIAADGLTYTFSLREGVKFHDGSPLTAEDVVASFNHILFPPPGVLSPRQGLFDAVKAVVATGPLTVEFRLTEPRSFLLRGLAAGFNVIMRKQTLEGNNYDLRVRRAINLVLDKSALSEAIYEVIPIVAAGWLLPTDPLFQEYWGKVREQPGWRSPTAEDRAEAKRLMKEAGYENGIKGLDFLVRDVTPHIATAPMVQDLLKRELKIESTIRQVASGVWYEEAQRGNDDLSITGFGVTIPHVADYWGNTFKTGGGYNWYGYSNPEFDTIVAAA